MRSSRTVQSLAILVIVSVLAPAGTLAVGLVTPTAPSGPPSAVWAGGAVSGSVPGTPIPTTAVASAASARAGPLPPCTTTVLGENPSNDSVQLAIDAAAPGAVVCLGPGTYPEQLNISVPGLTLRGAGNLSTIIAPNGTLSLNAKDVDRRPATPAWTIVLVYNAPGVRLENLDVSGAGALPTFRSLSGCPADLYWGVAYQNSSGTINASTITNVELTPNLFGCQPGVAVFAYNGELASHVVPSPALSVNVTNSTISAYDKNGLTCDDPGESCHVADTTVTGIGPTPLIAQNGIQISFGADGSVVASRVDANHYTGAAGRPTDANYFSNTTSTGILLYDPGNAVRVAGNNLSADDIGVAAVATVRATISQNAIDNAFDYGITLDLNASTGWVGSPLYGTASPRSTTLSGNTISGTNVGVLSYDDNVTISNGTIGNVNVSIESVVDQPGPSYVMSIDGLTARSHVSGALLGDLAGYQTTPGVTPKPLGTYSLAGDNFSSYLDAPPAASKYGMLVNASAVTISGSRIAGFVDGVVVASDVRTTSISSSTVLTPATFGVPVIGIWAGNQAGDPTNDTTGTVAISANTVVGPGGATDSPLAGSVGILAGGHTVSIERNVVDGFSAVNGSIPTNTRGPGSGYDWWEGTQSVGVLAACDPNATLAGCTVGNNSIANNTIGIVVILTNAAFAGTWETGPIDIYGNAITASGGYGIYTSMGGRHGGPSRLSVIQANTIDNSLTGAPALDLAGQSYSVLDNVFIGTSAAGNQGPVQGEGGPSIATASVQLTDYWDYSYGWTTATLGPNAFVETSLFCSTSLTAASLSSLACGEPLTFQETGLPVGHLWYTSLGSLNASATAPGPIVFSVPNGTVTYAAGAPAGYAARPAVGSVTVNGAPVTRSVGFVALVRTYNVTFSETGLNSGTLWYVNVTGYASGSSTSASIYLPLSNGTYGFVATTADDRFAPVAGLVTVAGADVIAPVIFRLVNFTVTFTETGLPLGHMWWINLTGGGSYSSTRATLSLEVPNGTYGFTAGATPLFPKQYEAAPGNVTVHGAPVAVSVSFVQVREIVFTETGLPVGMRWWANFTGGPSFSSAGPQLIAYLPAGSWTFTLSAANGSYSAPGGHFTVSHPLAVPHQAVHILRHFHKVTYLVTFTDSGLGLGARWCVTIVGGPTVCSIGAHVRIAETNGTYSYTVSTRAVGHTAPGGTFTVAGAPTAIAVTFT